MDTIAGLVLQATKDTARSPEARVTQRWLICYPLASNHSCNSLCRYTVS
jgi:hypothetical protein